MKFLEADAGESVYNFLCRALDVAKNEVKTLQATHNSVVIVVYPQSCINDLCDKYDLTQKLKTLGQNDPMQEGVATPEYGCDPVTTVYRF